ncbi:ABC transporter ATP-binding protein [Clostridium tyrobutyricum]|uniref:ABC transporter ATP-binding protein n=1 Tax=Clostridium tyrobutyricum TaxID=1519 RepID=UPI001C37EF53|nr:ABC transporter ATP-binding protein [Clostridium tyrobutyricum]MBV4418885.1 ABC transporter ATP-binding protein [Clostridium tyrobutyricum]
MANIIITKGLSKQYGGTMRVKDLDMVVKEGSIYGFLGPNGAGKSTTLKMILGLVNPTSGNISVFNKEINHKNRLSILKDVGSLIESPSYYGHLTGEENLEIVQTLRGVSTNRIDEVLNIVRLENQKNKKVSQYSLGMKQRLGIACALIGNPKLLILDEPTNGLDPAGIQEMRELICSLPKQYGMTIVVSSHILSEIDQMATDVGIIRKGELVFQNSLENLHSHSQEKILMKTLNNAAARAIILKIGMNCELSGDYIVLPKLSDSEIAHYNHILSKNNIGTVRIEEHKKSLEDIFLELTGKSVSL